MKQDIIYLRCRRVSSTHSSGLLKHHIDISHPELNLNLCGAHRSAQQWVNFLGEQRWNKAIKIFTLRNSFDNIVSIYLHKRVSRMYHPNEKIPAGEIKRLIRGFREKVKSELDSIKETPERFERFGSWYSDRNWKIYTINDKLVTNNILMYDNPRESWFEVLNNVGIKPDEYHINLFADRSQQATQKYNYRDFYDNETHELVKELRAKEINRFKFKLK